MIERCSLGVSLLAVAALVLGACAPLQRTDPPQISVAGIEPLQGEGLELRMLVKLRVQNPNDAPLEYDGVFLRLDVLDKPFATGVSDEAGRVPRFGETVISVPVTVSMLRMVSHAIGMLDGRPVERFNYRLYGKLHGPMFRSTRFETGGEIDLRGATSPRPPAVSP